MIYMRENAEIEYRFFEEKMDYYSGFHGTSFHLVFLSKLSAAVEDYAWLLN